MDAMANVSKTANRLKDMTAAKLNARYDIGPARTGLAAKVADPSYTLRRWLIPALLWLLMIAYKDVRLGRSTHLVDMANEHHRVTYTALSNTIIGVLLLAAAGFGAVAQGVGGWAVLALFAAMSLAAAGLALGLEEVQQDDFKGK